MCLMQKDGIIYFFHIDNIVFTFKKDSNNKIEKLLFYSQRRYNWEKKRVKIVFKALYNPQPLKKSLMATIKNTYYKDL